MTDFEEQALDLLEQIRDALTLSKRPSATENVDQVIIRRIRVITPGTLVQGPDVPLPIGYSVSIRQRRNTGTPEGYVGFSRNAVANEATRVIMLDNDSITVRISNFKEAWFDADTANTDFEMMAVR